MLMMRSSVFEKSGGKFESSDKNDRFTECKEKDR